MSILDEDIGSIPITRKDLSKLGFNIHRPLSEVFGEGHIYQMIKRVFIKCDDKAFHQKHPTQPVSSIMVRVKVEFIKNTDIVQTNLTPMIMTSTHGREWYNEANIVIKNTDLPTLSAVLTDEYILEKFKYFQLL